MSNPKVNCFIVGAAKCGTTSLYKYMEQHHQIFFPQGKKEVNYFATKYQNVPHEGARAWDIHDRKLVYEEKDYEEYYKGRTETICADASTEYLYYYSCAKDIYDYNPNAKIIIMLRNPANRAFSAYMHLRRDLAEEREFLEAFHESVCYNSNDRINDTKMSLSNYAGGGLYSESVRTFKEYFGNNVKIVIFEDFIKNPLGTMEEICSFLNIESYPFDTTEKYNESGISKNVLKTRIYLLLQGKFCLLKKILGGKITGKLDGIFHNMFMRGNLEKIQIDEEDKKEVLTYYADDILKLEKLLNRKLDWD